jgi:hypothetical protein
MSQHQVWSWADVPGLNGHSKLSRQRQGLIGRPRHAVTLGHHDGTIIPMAQRGEPVVVIASKLGCSDSVIIRRLQRLGVYY